MARPTGRYFASTISKIRDAKKKEKIVVDEGFKVQLRQQLMMKIAAQVQPARMSWTERLLPFKSYLAVVPALGLVIVAVVGISKLPIQFNSNVVVPTSAPSQQQNDVKPLSQTINIPMNIQSGDAGNTTGIKTFPGRLVLPPAYVSGGHASVLTSVAPESLTAPSTSQAPAVESGSKVSSPSPVVEQKVTSNSNPVSDNVTQASLNTSRVGQGDVQSSSPAVQQAPSQTPVTPSVSGSTALGQSVQAGAGVAPSVSGAVPMSDQAPAVQDVAAPKVAQTELTQPAVKEPAPVVAFKPVEPAAPSPLTLNDIASLPAQHLGLQVQYKSNFSGDERTILEKNLLPHLVDGKEVSYITVFQKDAATIVIQLNLKNGEVATFNYMIDANGTLQLIQPRAANAADANTMSMANSVLWNAPAVIQK